MPKQGVDGLATLKDVAERAGVSIATVSRYLSGSLRLKPETRARIETALQELDYHPNEAARSLVSGRSTMVALLVPDMSNPFFAELAKGVHEVGTQNGYDLIVYDTGGDARQEQAAVRSLRGRQVQGFILAGAINEQQRLFRENVAALIDEDAAVVLINRRAGRLPVPEISHDGHTAAVQAVQHLVELGHRRIGFVSGPPVAAAIEGALKGFVEISASLGLGQGEQWQEQSVAYADMTFAGGQAATAELLRRNPDLTAVVAFSEQAALGALRACREAGRRVPDHCSVAAIGETYLATVVDPALTAVTFDTRQTGRLAMRTMIGLMHRDDVPADRLVRRPQLYIRESTAAPPRGR